jgi:hypothetical protein
MVILASAFFFFGQGVILMPFDRYERYAETDVASYGQMGADPFADLFPEFD